MNALLLVLALSLSGDEPIPAQNGLISDFAGIIDQETLSKLKDLLEKTKGGGKAVLAVATSKQTGPIEDYSVRMAKAWGIGKKKENNGILLLVCPDEKAVRIEVGYGMEPTLTDIDSKRIIERIMIPRFKEGKYSEAILAGATAISSKVYDGKIPDSLDVPVEKVEVPLGLIGVIVVVVLLMLCFGPTRGILFAVLSAVADSKSSGGGSSKGSSGSGSSGSSGGSFGGGGSSGKW